MKHLSVILELGSIGMGMFKRMWSSELIFLLLLSVLGSCHVFADSAVPSLANDGDPLSSSIITRPVVKLDPTVEYLGPYKTTTLWQIPPGPVKKVLFVAIGSGTLPWDYWDRTPGCPLCRGLPEMRKIVEDALSRRYAVILISPLNFGHGWEAWPRDSTDLVNAVSILSRWKVTHGFGNTSTVALGPSAGGHALSTLGLQGQRLFDSMVLMVSKGMRQVWRHVRRDYYPPTLFVHCPRDSKTAEAILEIMRHLRSQGIPSDEIQILPHPITPTWFSQLIPGLDPSTSRAIYDALKGDGSILDEEDYLLKDFFDWQSVVRARNVLPEDPENPGQLLYKAAIDQEMRVAWAMHTTLARKNEEIFKWFEGDHDVRSNKEDSSIFQEDEPVSIDDGVVTLRTE